MNGDGVAFALIGDGVAFAFQGVVEREVDSHAATRLERKGKGNTVPVSVSVSVSVSGPRYDPK